MLLDGNPALEAADIHNYAESGNSFLDSASDFVTKGVPLAVGSGLVSMANTGVALGNSLGGDFDKIDYDKEVKSYDDDLGKYYQENKDGIDIGGFIATSFIPGLGGIKALKMIQGGMIGKSAAAITSLFKDKEALYLEKALSSVQTETNQIFRTLDANKIAAIAAGAGEQFLQAGAFETGVMISMNQNPTINKEDTGYFSTLLYNSPEMLKSALIGGGIGGGINALAIGGKIKGAIRARDKDDFPSLHLNEVGTSDIDPGTKIAMDFYWLKGRQKDFEAQQAAGEINERQVSNFQKTQEQKANELFKRINEDLTGKDASLSKAVWNHLLGTDLAGSDAPEEVGLRLLGAATNIERIGTDDSIKTGTKVYFGDSQLSDRHAKNILNRGKVAPGNFDEPSAVDLEEMKLAGYELYQDTASNYRVIPGIKYESQLKRSVSKNAHDFIVKLSGDQAGRISESAYPVLGDLGDVKFKEGKLLVNGVEREVKAYDPVANDPMDSNAAFIREELAPKFHEDLGTVEIDSSDLPRLEKAHKEQYPDVVVTDAEGNPVNEGAVDKETITRAKLEVRQQLINEGHPFDRIAREINSSQEFAETGRGEAVLTEDHTGPMYGRFAYNTNSVPDGNYLRGVSDLIQRVQIAKEHNAKVAALILGDAYNELPKTEGTMLGINTIPELGNFVKSADEMYGSFGQLMQSVGKIADREIRARIEDVLGRISSMHAEIQGDETLLRNFNLMIAKIRSSPEAMVWLDDKTLIPKSLAKEVMKEGADGDAIMADAFDRKIPFVIDEPIFQNYLRVTQDINAQRVQQYNAYFAAKGSATKWDDDIMYVPPINTRKYPFVAFVRETVENEFRPVSVITASDASALEAKVRSVKQEFGDTLSLYTKDDIKNWYQMQGEYESGLLLGNSTVDSALAKKGVLSDFAPRTDNEILNDFDNWHVQNEQMLVRNAIELQYAQEFAELRAMGSSFLEFQKSKFGKTLTDKEYSELKKENPYEKYIQTALAISNFTKYDSVWGRMNSAVEGFGQSMFKVWDSVVNKANKGEMSWEAANAEAQKLGFRPPFSNVLKEIFNPVITDRKIVEPLVSKANGIMATMILRLDPLNSIVNIMGTPALLAGELNNIRKNLSNPDIVGKLNSLLQVGIPGGTNQMPSTVGLISKALSNFVHDDGSLLDYYQKIGAVRSDLRLYKDVLDASQITPDHLVNNKSVTDYVTNLAAKAADMGATLTGNNLSERMVRFVAADIMRQIGETAQLSQPELSAYINTFVNRVHGNYTASQRPALFQGAVGQAISLFQTYQFNVIQNITRYVEQNDKVSIAALLGLQNTIFGMQGNPAFYLLNSYIGQNNREHKDLVTSAYATVGKDVGDWMLYGLGSNALHTNLYNRGDLTPRYVTVVPTTVADIPAISIPAKVISNFVDTISTIAKGGSLKQSILEGLATNGVNRPMAGLAQLAQGYRTTNKGSMLVAYNDLDTWTIAAKISGGEEMNRAVAIDAYYRNVAYKKKDAENIADVGEALKNKIRSGEPLNPEDVTGFMGAYSRAGGRTDTFNRFMVDQMKTANKSQITKMMDGMRTPLARNLSTIMGAQDEEYLHMPGHATEPEPVEPQQ